MNPAIDDERLSAYLDGELTGVEKADFENRLAADPAARQALEELRAVSAGVRSLPRYQLGEDLTPSVLRLAEQRMLTEGPAAPVVQPRQGALRGRRFLRTRSLVWAGMAVAIGLVFMLFDANRGTKPGDNNPAGPGGVQAKSVDREQPAVVKPADNVLLVKCYLSDQSGAKRAFDLLLARHNVVRDVDDRLTAGALARDTSRVGDKWIADGKQKSFYAEIQPAAIQAVLEELAAKPELCLAVVVVGAPGAKTLEPWQAFSRDFGQSAPSSKPSLPAASKDLVRVVFAVQGLKPANVSKPAAQE